MNGSHTSQRTCWVDKAERSYLPRHSSMSIRGEGHHHHEVAAAVIARQKSSHGGTAVGSKNNNKSWTNVLKCLAIMISATSVSNYLLMRDATAQSAAVSDGGGKSPSSSKRSYDELVARNLELETKLRHAEEALQKKSDAVVVVEERRRHLPSAASSAAISAASSLIPPTIKSSSQSSQLLVKANSINSYWWPSAEHDGGLLGRIYASQNPIDCSSNQTKFFIWQSLRNNQEDTRGLTAFAHAGISHLFHALTDGDAIVKQKSEAEIDGAYDAAVSSRVLLSDDKLWPMAKGCEHGPETRDCYFEPLSSTCTLKHVNNISDTQHSFVLSKTNEEYNRSVRTIYSSQRIWYRITENKYSWINLPSGSGSSSNSEKDHSAISITAAAFAYYFRLRPWLIQEIDARIRQSIPSDLNPDRTVGIPIRRSDKCHGHNITGSAKGELECPPLSLYLEGLRSFIAFDPNIENVIVTSEDKLACDEFLELLATEMPNLRVILNVGDVQQGTGSGSHLESYVEGAVNANVVASALTSLHLHLRARYFVITSKSTWTSTIAVMARVHGFATGEISVIDIGRNHNTFSSLARSGCV